MVISQPLYLDQKLSIQALAPLDKCWFPVIKKYYPDGFIAKCDSCNLHMKIKDSN
mgnify:CR=1 FL=1